MNTDILLCICTSCPTTVGIKAPWKRRNRGLHLSHANSRFRSRGPLNFSIDPGFYPRQS